MTYWLMAGERRMRFVFSERRAAQAAAHLLQLHGGTMNYMVLIKLLYLSDKEALIHTGQPITGDRMLSMDNGPVLSRVLDFINMGRPDDVTPWFEYISEPHAYEVSLIRAAETDELSAYELRVLDAVHETYGRMNKWALVRWTHTLPEWSDPAGSCFAIDPDDILRSAGKSQEEIERITRDAEEMWALHHLVRIATQ